MKTLTPEQVTKVLIKNGVATWNTTMLPDRLYVMPTFDFIRTKFSDALERMQYLLKVNKWLAETNDCDDFARVAAALAQVMHVNTPNHPENTALAFGEYWYTTDKGGGHAINVVLTGEGEGDVKFYEPQTRRFVQLSENEKKDNMLLRI